MQKNKKVFVGVVIAGFAMFVSNSAQASSSKYDWKKHFSYEEVKSLKKQTSNSIKNKFKDDSDWKDIISGSNIKDDAVTSEKIKNGTIGAADVDSSIVKKKIYTGTAPDNASKADKTITTNDVDSTILYFFKLNAPEISTSNMPIVHVYGKISSDSVLFDGFGGMWEEQADPVIENGKVWIEFAMEDEDAPGVPSYEVTDYKVVVQY